MRRLTIPLLFAALVGVAAISCVVAGVSAANAGAGSSAVPSPRAGPAITQSLLSEAIDCEKKAKGQTHEPHLYAGTLADCLQLLYQAHDQLANEPPGPQLDAARAAIEDAIEVDARAIGESRNVNPKALRKRLNRAISSKTKALNVAAALPASGSGSTTGPTPQTRASVASLLAQAIDCEKKAKGQTHEPHLYAGTLADCLQLLYQAHDQLANEPPGPQLDAARAAIEDAIEVDARAIGESRTVKPKALRKRLSRAISSKTQALNATAALAPLVQCTGHVSQVVGPPPPPYFWQFGFSCSQDTSDFSVTLKPPNSLQSLAPVNNYVCTVRSANAGTNNQEHCDRTSGVTPANTVVAGGFQTPQVVANGDATLTVSPQNLTFPLPLGP